MLRRAFGMGDRFKVIPPMSLSMYLIWFLLLLLFLPFFWIMFLGSITVAFVRLGIPPSVAVFLLFLSLLGSLINIPVAEVKGFGPVIREREVSFFGMKYYVPQIEMGETRTVIAVNFGGAIVPVSVAIYEIFRMVSSGQFLLLGEAAIAVAIATFIFHYFAKPVQGVGIALPFFLPPLVAAVLGLTIGYQNPVVVAYLAGTLGTLIGADLMNLGKIKDLGAPMASIGGAGTFDGIFLSGIVSVLLV